MQKLYRAGNTLAAVSLALSLSMAGAALADDHKLATPFGEGDQAGASNLMTPDKVKEAMGLMKTGTVISIGRTYESEMPLFGSRVFALRGTSGLAGGPLAENNVIWMDDYLSTEIGQVGTQFDGLAHIGIGGENPVFYGGVPASEVFGSYGVRKLGMEHIKPFFTRGILIDMVALRGRSMELGEEVTDEDIKAALEKQGISPPGEGDVVIIHTGWGSLWIEDNAKFNSGAPGIGLSAAKYLGDAGVAIVGADTWPVEVVPNPDASLAFPVHQELLTRRGIFIHENIATERLAEAGVSEFAYIYSPMPTKGATGSPGAPLAAF